MSENEYFAKSIRYSVFFETLSRMKSNLPDEERE